MTLNVTLHKNNLMLRHTVNTQGEAIVSFVMDNYQTSRDEYAAEPI